MLLDANVLLYAVDRSSPQHDAAADWLIGVMNGSERVAFPWQTIGAFVRIVTHPRVLTHPLTGDGAWAIVEQWLAAPIAWVPPTTRRTAEVLGGLIRRHAVSGNLVPDAQLAALAIEHGIAVVSADSDFARFPEVRWVNPLQVS